MLITEKMTKHKQPKVGLIYSISLPNGQYGYGRVMRDGGFQVFVDETDMQDFSLVDTAKVEFVVGMYFDAYADSRTSLVGEKVFNSEEEEWPPKTFIYNPALNTYSVYYKGVAIPARRKQCLRLESCSTWELDHVIERKMGNNWWVKVLS